MNGSKWYFLYKLEGGGDTFVLLATIWLSHKKSCIMYIEEVMKIIFYKVKTKVVESNFFKK